MIFKRKSFSLDQFVNDSQKRFLAFMETGYLWQTAVAKGDQQTVIRCMNELDRIRTSQQEAPFPKDHPVADFASLRSRVLNNMYSTMVAAYKDPGSVTQYDQELAVLIEEANEYLKRPDAIRSSYARDHNIDDPLFP